MAQVKLLKINATDGIPTEFNSASDDITLASFTVQGGGPVLGATGLDLNNQDIVDIKNTTYNNSATGTVTVTAGSFFYDDFMFQTRENSIAVGSAILFPTVSDVANEVDAFRIPTLAGVPTATPADGGEGYQIYDSVNDFLYIWNGSQWKNQSIVEDAERIVNEYTAGENLAICEGVYISAANTVMLSDVSAAGAASRLLGFAKAAALSAAPVLVASEGVLDGFSGLTAGSRYYANPAVAGGVTATLPVGSGNTIVQSGYAKSATQMHLQIAQLGRRA